MTDVPLDFEFFRAQFPFFQTAKAKEWSFFDNAGGSFPCRQVIDRLTKFYIENKVQPYPQNALAGAAYDQLNEGRQVMAEILGVPEPTLTLGASSTQNFNTLAAACVGMVKEGDEIICSEQDHEANIGGWERACTNAKAKFSLWPVNEITGELELETLKNMVSSKTKVISLTHCSNMIGTINPIKEILAVAKSVGAKLVIDGVSYAPHQWPNILELGVDAYGLSTYKTYGTHQGVLYVKEDFMQELKVQSHFFYDDLPGYRLNSSGHDHACVAALSGLGEFVETLYAHHFGKSNFPLSEKAQQVSKILLQYENSLCEQFLQELTNLPVKIYGKTKMSGRESNISFIPNNMSPANLTDKLATRGIALSLSHFDCVRMFNRLGLDLDKAALRVSFAPYNSEEDLKKLISALKEFLL
jgi:selenocysteine lyase/cysteine desulfurase